jgi:lipopolysaccharide transport system ATP-binding protein
MQSDSGAEAAVVVEGLGKRYRLGQRESYKTIREALSRIPGRDVTRKGHFREDREFWALKDISFSVGHGEVIGIIGHNGAGKSTLLKLLARVTAPTEGRAIIEGRVSALLEVGTGFQPELTGRENVFLNGSILGMRQSEIRSRFDEIVEFAEIERFLDTPIKRYSSGMQVRLAFAVAAFLEPDILIVDEVLAVGDVAFQRKCLGKLGAGAMTGRTVLFVSHNMSAIRTLCPRSILIDHGRIAFDGLTELAVERYLSSGAASAEEWDASSAERPNLEMRGAVQLHRARLLEPVDTDMIPVGSSMTIEVIFEIVRPTEDYILVLNISTMEDVLVAQAVSTNSLRPFRGNDLGWFSAEVKVESVQLQPGRYSVGLGIRSSQGLEDHANRVGTVEFVEPDDVEFLWFSSTNGYLRLRTHWTHPRSHNAEAE